MVERAVEDFRFGYRFLEDLGLVWWGDYYPFEFTLSYWRRREDARCASDGGAPRGPFEGEEADGCERPGDDEENGSASDGAAEQIAPP
jgi:hypothetical protein